jgi:hypothetical protein
MLFIHISNRFTELRQLSSMAHFDFDQSAALCAEILLKYEGFDTQKYQSASEIADKLAWDEDKRCHILRAFNQPRFRAAVTDILLVEWERDRSKVTGYLRTQGTGSYKIKMTQSASHFLNDAATGPSIVEKLKQNYARRVQEEQE